ncbi:AfsR/SARP family transcriptional regulator [Actinophytocola oryzae]|uniref:DNA-binding SARP family transcriptional activator n=1 Tax=Actinophytocola oryzae TaxID=502181 RepID=A0A4V3FV60_9PSEU|nr:tetratricopeptide repeat protein [Actinophytocola oryzae]TDV57801.1 DNA-binding SARP family transcriptional activator [Actinophytocola oryzae]
MVGVVRVQVLGPLRAWHDGGEIDLGPPGRRAVLGLLALAGGEAVTIRDLVDALWADRPPRSALNVLQTHVKHLRRLMEPDRPPRGSSQVLPRLGGGYAVNRDAVDVDLLHVRGLVAEASAVHRDGDTARVTELLGKVLRLWRGRPLADLPFLAKNPTVVALVAERRKLVARYGDAMIASGAAADALPDLTEAAEEQPLDEPAQARLISAYHAVGQRAAAFRLYHEVRDRLVEELGVDPGPELRAAHTALLADDHDTEVTAAPRPTHRTPKQLPAQPHGFTGRTTQLSTLDALLPGTQTVGAPAIVAISGTAGVGKTALAVHWAHRVRDRFPDGQLYANLLGHAPGSPAPPVEILARFLSALGIAADRVPTDQETASALYRTLTTDRKMLVLLDNAACPEQVRPLLPSGAGCLVVVTGRETMGGLVATSGARTLTLDVLSGDDAIELLAHVLGPERVRAEHAAAVEFAELCVHLPLALRIAAANLAGSPWRGVSEYVAELRTGNLLAALAMRGDEHTAVRTAFGLSYTALPDAARRVFRLLSLAPGTDVSAEAVAVLSEVDLARATDVLERLTAAHLVEHHARGRYRFHDLLRRYAAEQAEREESAAGREAAVARLYDWYLRTVDGAAGRLYPHMLRLPVPESDGDLPSEFAQPAGASGWLDTELANLVAAIRHAGPHPVAWQLADALRGFFWMSMRRMEWHAAAEAALAAADAAGDPRARAAARLNLADLHFRQSRYAPAVRHYTHALLLAHQAGWQAAEAAVLGNLGLVYWRSGRLTAAARRFARGLALSRSIGQRAGEAVALGNLGLVAWRLGRLAEAQEHFGEALRQCRRIGSVYGEAISLANLGRARRVAGHPVEATELLITALALYREAGNRSGEAETHGHLAAAYAELGRRDEAFEHCRAGLTMARETGDPRLETEVLTTFATVHHRYGHREDAIRHFGEALALIRTTGDRYPEVDALVGLATATGDAEHARHALALGEREGYRALRGQALTALAEILLAGGRPADAAAHAGLALAVHRETGHRLGERRALAVLSRAAPTTGRPPCPPPSSARRD